MASETPKPQICGQKFFTSPDPYFAVHYVPRPSCPDWAKVLCESAEDGAAIAAYLSPLDAMVDAAYFSTPGKPYHIIHATQFDPTDFIEAHSGRLIINLHTPWVARNRHLVLRHQGQLAGYAAVQEQSVSATHIHHIEFVIERETLDVIDRIHQLAELFAYHENFAHILSWDERQRHRAVAKAIQMIPRTLPSSSECDQLALYVPEGE